LRRQYCYNCPGNYRGGNYGSGGGNYGCHHYFRCGYYGGCHQRRGYYGCRYQRCGYYGGFGNYGGHWHDRCRDYGGQWYHGCCYIRRCWRSAGSSADSFPAPGWRSNRRYFHLRFPGR